MNRQTVLVPLGKRTTTVVRGSSDCRALFLCCNSLVEPFVSHEIVATSSALASRSRLPVGGKRFAAPRRLVCSRMAACEPARRPRLAPCDAACGRAGRCAVTNRPDKPMELRFIQSPLFAMPKKFQQQRQNTNRADLRRFRVTIQSTDWYEVDVLAPDAEAAEERAEFIDSTHLGSPVDGEWKAVSSREISAEEFSPPDLPASSWTA